MSVFTKFKAHFAFLLSVLLFSASLCAEPVSIAHVDTTVLPDIQAELTLAPDSNERFSSSNDPSCFNCEEITDEFTPAASTTIYGAAASGIGQSDPLTESGYFHSLFKPPKI